MNVCVCVCVCVCVSIVSDKENMDRSTDSSASGFDSPAGKLVSHHPLYL